MESLRIKIELGERKFEAEGPAELVQATFNAFLKLSGLGAVEAVEEPADVRLPLETIFRLNGTLVTLTVRARSVSETILLILLGQRELRESGPVSGAEIMQGLRASGVRRGRVDNLINTHSRNGYLSTIGKRRGRRYQLTDSGLLKAREIARGLIALVQPPSLTRRKASAAK